MGLGLIADQDQLQSDRPLAGGGRLDEQAAIDLERERALAARWADRTSSATTSAHRP